MKSIDFVSPKPSIFVEKKSRYASAFGGFFTAFLVIYGISLLFCFGSEIFTKSNPSVNYSFGRTAKLFLEGSKIQFGVAVFNQDGSQVDNYKFTFRLTEIDAQRAPISVVSEIEMVECQDSFGLSTHTYYCVPSSFSYSITGEYCSDKFSYAEILIDQKTPRKEANLYMHAILTDNYVDVFNFENPIKEDLHSFLYEIQPETKYNFHFSLQKVIFFDDDSLFGSDKKMIEGFSVVDKTLDLASLQNNNAFVTVSLGFNDHVQLYSRKYTKVQDIFSRVGGGMKAVFLLTKISLFVFCKLSSRMKVIDFVEIDSTDNSSINLKNTGESSFRNKKEVLTFLTEVKKIVLTEKNLLELCILHEINKKDDFKLDQMKRDFNQNIDLFRAKTERSSNT